MPRNAEYACPEAHLNQQVYAISFDVRRHGGNPMTTAIFDADSHLMETEDWLGSFADPQVRDQLLPLSLEVQERRRMS